MRWVIGDVHGMLRSLETLIAQIGRVDSKPAFYFVGDFVNRGPDSRGVIDLVLSLPSAKVIRGNHDDILDEVLHGSNFAENDSRGDRCMAFAWFLEHGLLQTLRSYGATDDQISRVMTRRNQEALDPIIDLFPPAHRNFIQTLPVFIEDDDLFVVHGKWPLREKSSPKELLCGEIPIPQLRQEVLWGRFTAAELERFKSWPKRGFFGHTPVQTYRGHHDDSLPITRPKLVLLDTAAALVPHGRLTAMCAESSQLIQADPNGHLVEQHDVQQS